MNPDQHPKENNKIGVRGFPNGIFNPWVRWITGLAVARNSSAAAAAVAVARPGPGPGIWKLEKCKYAYFSFVASPSLPDEADRSVISFCFE